MKTKLRKVLMCGVLFGLITSGCDSSAKNEEAVSTAASALRESALGIQLPAGWNAQSVSRYGGNSEKGIHSILYVNLSGTKGRGRITYQIHHSKSSAQTEYERFRELEGSEAGAIDCLAQGIAEVECVGLEGRFLVRGEATFRTARTSLEHAVQLRESAIDHLARLFGGGAEADKDD